MRLHHMILTSVAIGALALSAQTALAQGFVSDAPVAPDNVTLGKKEYSPYLHRAYPDRVLWGDTHLHTSYSTDAGMIGNFLEPDEAFRLARGETVRAAGGVRTKLIRPLDFLVVADHAENLGLAPLIEESSPDLLRKPWGKMVHDLVKAGKPFEAYAVWGLEMAKGEDPLQDDDLTRTMWNRIVASAEKFNQPGAFTALHGFEWTSSPEANNLHRVVIFRDDADKVEDLIPYSNYDSADPEDLWKWMESYEKKSGGKILAIPHNGNLSNGLMFDDVTLSGKKPLTKDYAERRARWEPLYEVTQIKGDGEAHPALSPNDEFADYWTWDKGNFGLAGKKPDMLPREYARSALKRGLKHEAKLGVNPFKFGMIGSTDSHTSLATTREENSFGKATPVEPGAGNERYEELITGIMQSTDGSDVKIRHYKSLASGLAGVWARDTRTALWDALARKEVYASTGTRLTVRVFAGWDFEKDEVVRPDFAAQGYARGVPMGGDLTNGPADKAPTLMIRALRDPDGANLDRIQIVKGWLDKDGKTQEKVYDVVWAGERKADANGKLPPVGNTVNGARFTNDIGNAVLGGFWSDPDFDPALRAFYYVRVLEIPTPTWLAYDKAFYGDKIKLPDDAQLVHQERAYTSPIWYTPKG